jgi:hypothetical protein
MNAAPIETVPKRSIAEVLFEASMVESALEERLVEAGVEFERLSWDWYDCSLEIYGVTEADRLSDAAQKVVHDAGFAKVYVNHVGKDHWETHYTFKTAEFAPVKGWRVSYPHKRNDGSTDIWVEENVVGWPTEWIKTGYVKVKQWFAQP